VLGSTLTIKQFKFQIKEIPGMLMHMHESCLKKQNAVKELFTSCGSEELKYQKLIEIGRQLPKLPASDKKPENLVTGCQSTMFLTSRLENGGVIFSVESDALVSAGLAALLVLAYNGETPETILKCPPSFLEELGVSASLTPSRANGLYSIHLRMKQDALQLLVNNS
jgi:cysteine desulfuration protein SufE